MMQSFRSSRNTIPAQRLAPRTPHAVEHAQLVRAPEAGVLQVGDVLEEALTEARARR